MVTAPLQSALPTGGSQLRSSDPRLAPYLALPAQPAVVDQLAHQAVGDATTPAAKAQALVNWFRSGRFRYTLSPPPTGGSNPLVQFLTVTKAGFCEQFAGAYGVLARSLGIPTRLVVGFTAGQLGSDGTTTVTGADAHVWPQVYLGPDAGWVSVEPTPPSATGEPGAEGVVGPSGTTGSHSTTASTEVAAPTAPVTSAGASPAGSQSAPSPPPKRQPASARAPGHGSAWWAVLAVIAALLLAAARRLGPAPAARRSARRPSDPTSRWCGRGNGRSWRCGVRAWRAVPTRHRPSSPCGCAGRPAERTSSRPRQMRWPTWPDWSNWRATRPGRVRRPKPPGPRRWPRRSWGPTDRTGVATGGSRRGPEKGAPLAREGPLFPVCYSCSVLRGATASARTRRPLSGEGCPTSRSLRAPNRRNRRGPSPPASWKSPYRRSASS